MLNIFLKFILFVEGNTADENVPWVLPGLLTHTYGYCLSDSFLKLYDTDLKSCLEKCSRRPRCRSVSYMSAFLYCGLNGEYGEMARINGCLHMDVRMSNGLQIVSKAESI